MSGLQLVGSPGVLARLAALAAANTADSGEIQNRDITHIGIIASAPSVFAKVSITAELRKGTGGNAVVLPQLPGILVAELSDVLGGQNFRDVQLASEIAGPPADYRALVAVAIPIGYLRLRGGDVLAGTITALSALGAAETAKLCYFRRGTQLGEKVWKYQLLDADKNVVVQDAVMLAAYRRTIGSAVDEAGSLTAAKLTITVRESGNELPIEGDIGYGAMLAFGQLGSLGPQQTLVFWADMESGQGVSNVGLSLAGSDAAAWSVLAVSNDNDAERTSLKGAEAVAEAHDRVAAIERQAPAVAQAARHQGRLPHSANLARMANTRASSLAVKNRGTFSR